MSADTRTVIRGWTVRPFQTAGLCRCGELGETFSVNGGAVALFDLCAVCVDHWTLTQARYSRRCGVA
jgi:hypothetical protein